MAIVGATGVRGALVMAARRPIPGADIAGADDVALSKGASSCVISDCQAATALARPRQT